MVDVPANPRSTRHSTVASSSRSRIARVRSCWGTRATGVDGGVTCPSWGVTNKQSSLTFYSWTGTGPGSGAGDSSATLIRPLTGMAVGDVTDHR